MSKNNFGISPVISKGKLAWIELQAPSIPSVIIRIDRDLVLEMHALFGQLIEADASGDLAAGNWPPNLPRRPPR